MVKHVFTYYKTNCMKGISLRFRIGAAKDKVLKENHLALMAPGTKLCGKKKLQIKNQKSETQRRN